MLRSVHDLFTILLECEIISNVVMQKIDYFSESPFILYRCFVTFSKVNFHMNQTKFERRFSQLSYQKFNGNISDSFHTISPQEIS